MTERENMDGAVGRTFWIQGRSGVYWQNLEDIEDGQAAIARLGVLVGQGRYDELRLIQAEISPITGASSYQHIVTVRDGQVLTPSGAPFPAAARARLDEGEPAPEQMPQLLLWPEAEEDEADRQHPLPLKEVLEERTRRTKGPPVPDRRVPARRLDDGSWDVGGWRISEAAHAAIDEAEDAEATRGAGDKVGKPGASGLAVEREDARIFARRQRDEPTDDARKAGRRRGLLARVGRRRGRAEERARRPDGRVALMSGVFAGAIAIGLAISAAAPDRAADLYAAALRDLRVLAPDLSLDEAVAAGDIAALHGRLAAGANPNARDTEGTPLLLRAARGGNLQAVSLLLQAGADPTLPGPDGRSVLHRAAAEGLSLALARMLDAGAPVDLAGGTYGCVTPLSAAASAGMARAASILAERGASLDPQPDCAAGPMEIAAAHPLLLGRLEAIRAEREGWIRLATGPRPPQEAPRHADTAPQDGEIRDTNAPAARTESGAPVAVASAAPMMAPPAPSSGPSRIAENDLLHPHGTAGAGGHAQGAPTPDDAAPDDATALKTAAGAPLAPVDAPREAIEVAGLTAKAAPPPTADDGGGESAGPRAAARQPAGDPPPIPRVKPPPPPPTVEIAEAAEDAARVQTASVPRKPQDADSQAATIATAIDQGRVEEVERLTADIPVETLARFTIVADDRYGAGERGLVDHAVLRGRRRIADMLMARGLAPTPTALHAAIANAGRPELAGTVDWLLDGKGIDIDARIDGLTPLMRAALRGRADIAETLLAAGADPGKATEDGRTAADFAHRAGRTELQETLLLAAQEQRYRALMFGMSWTDTMDTLAARIERCKDIGDGFTACKLRTDAWLDDASVVVGQFDRRAGGRLVALQIDSRPIGDPTAARRRFEEVASAIEDRLPSDHGGFTNRRAPEDSSFFHALRPEINQGAYFGYWPDHDRARPVFVHLKLAGIDDSQGFYRIVIGNPFRAS